MKKSEKHKILILITRLNNGGAAKHALILGNLINRHTFEVVLAHGKTGKNENDISDYTTKYQINNCRIKYLRRHLNPLNDLICFFLIYKLIKKEQPDILHTHMSKAGFIGRSAVILYNILHKKKVKTVHTFHGHVFHSYFSKFKTSIFILIEKLLAKKTDVLITVSERIRDEVRKEIKVKDLKIFKVIPLGIERISPERMNKNSPEKGWLHVGMLGRLAPVKNYHLAVKIAKILRKRKIRARIFIGGAGSVKQSNELKELANGSINFMGYIEHPVEFWKNMDIAMITSKNEGTPVSLIEAMFSEIPFVATCVGGIPDLTVGREYQHGNLSIYCNCILVNSQNPYDFAEAIAYYCNNNKKRFFAGRIAGSFARARFSIKQMSETFNNLYQSLLNQ